MKQVGLEADGAEPGAVFGLDLVESGLAVVLEVHLIDQDGHLADAQEVEEVAVAAGVFLDSFAGIDQEQGGLGIGGTGDHVFQELLVARRVDDDVLAPGGVKPNLRRIDGDVLVALRLQRVHQVGPLEGDAAPAGNGLELLDFALGERTGVVEQPAHKSGFAVVHVADDDDFELFGGRGR